MAKIAVDIDDTLYSFTSLARQKLVELYKETGDDKYKEAAYAPWMEWRSPPGILGLDVWLHVIERTHDPELVTQQRPYLHAREVLWDLVHAGHDLIYISNRDPELHGPTSLWLEACDFPSSISYDSMRDDLGDRVQLICTLGDKHQHIRTCQYIIDDRPKTLVEFVYDFNWKLKMGTHAPDLQRAGFALKTEFNFQLTDVPGIYIAPDWNLLRDYLVKKGLLLPSQDASTHQPSLR